MERAMRVLDDPTTIGVVQGYLSDGQLAKAVDVLAQAEQQLAQADEEAALEKTDKQLGDLDKGADVSELTARFGGVEKLLASLQQRLDRLEQRPRAPAPAAPQTIAKAAGSKQRMTAEEQKTKLLHEIDTYVADPSTVGFLTSKLEAGAFAEVRSVVAGAKRAHESARAAHERKAWSR